MEPKVYTNLMAKQNWTSIVCIGIILADVYNNVSILHRKPQEKFRF